jgi:hypothetical protein
MAAPFVFERFRRCFHEKRSSGANQQQMRGQERTGAIMAFSRAQTAPFAPKGLARGVRALKERGVDARFWRGACLIQRFKILGRLEPCR